MVLFALMEFSIAAKVEKFCGKAAWHYIRIPKNISQTICGNSRGMVPVEVVVHGYKWNTSLLPIGDGDHFIALKKEVREKCKIKLGDSVKIEFKVRD